MEDNFSNDQDGLISEIFGTTTYEAQGRTEKKEFKPWHRPRKQFVREKQWGDDILNLVRDLNPENKTLTYLGLPGDDLLDLRYFHDRICKPNELMLKFLGFNNSEVAKAEASTDLNISKHEISKLEYISAESEIIPDDFCQIGTDKSLANQRSKKMGPFDVINIDLCNGFGRTSHEDFEENHYNTLKKLMTFQQRRKDPWLLFITTRTGLEHTDPKVLALLKDLYAKNLKNCDPFLKASIKAYNVGDLHSVEKAITTDQGASDVFLVALCKWIAFLGIELNPKIKIEVQSVYGYKVHPKAVHLDLVSLSLKMVPTDITKQDSLGLAKAFDGDINECDAAVQALMAICGQEDVDEKLADDQMLMDQMIKATGGLLGLARYDVHEYYASRFAK